MKTREATEMDLNPDPAPGQYWTCTAGDSAYSSAPKVGDRVLIISTEEEIWIAHGKSQFGYDPEEFVRGFKFCPTGQEDFIREFTDLMGKVTSDQLAMEGSFHTFEQGIESGDEPALLPSAMDASQDEEPKDRTVALAATTTQASMETAQKRVKDLRLSLKRYRLTVAKQSERLMHMLESQRALLDKRVKRMSAMVEKAEEAVWTLNLYLGKDEQIVRLKKGPPPPAETKIVVRQLVLYMDEECAFAAEKGGIDWQNIPDFDKWLMDTAHLEQVLPEVRGVVAIKPRRNEKEYGDPGINDAMNRDNKKTYWLIRNGGSLYRIWTALDVRDVIVPKAEEFDRLMREDSFWGRFNKDAEPPKPGSPNWMKAMKRVDSRRRHYMRILLFLQGLIDRTKVFWPLPGDRINIMKERVHAQYVDYVYDGEESRMLPSGKQDFSEWRKDLNHKLEVGHRIVGHYPWERNERRVHPRTADRPEDLKLYTIDRVKDGHPYFRYDRGGTIWTQDKWTGRHVEHAPKRRASYQLYFDDSFYLNFDLATVEDMQFYLRDRINRHHYTEMFPVLKVAIAMKKKETEEEAPFRLLLVGEIMKACHVSRAEAEIAVEELVPWWKFKTRTHRALLSDDAKALRMIVAEHRRRWEALHDRTDHQPYVGHLLQTYPTALAIYYKGGGEYVIFAPENAEKTFVRETHWSGTFDVGGAQVDDRRWTVLDSRLQSWVLLWDTESFQKEWSRTLRREKYLSDPELTQIVDLVREKVQKTQPDQWQTSWYDKGPAPKRDLVCVTLAHRESTVRAYFSDCTADDDGPHTVHADFDWIRTKDGLQLKGYFYAHRVGYHDTAWTTERVIWKDEEKIKAHDAAREVQGQRVKEGTVQNEEAAWVVEQVHTAMVEALKEKERKAYKEEYGDDDTFDEEHKSVRWADRIYYSDRVRRAASLVVEQGKDINGWTLRQLMDEAKQLGFKKDKKEDARDEHNTEQGVGLPLDLVLKSRAAQEAEWEAERESKRETKEDDSDFEDVEEDEEG